MGETTGRVLIVIISLAVAACQSLPNVDREECGNLVLDRDEDCDGTSQFGDNTACGEPETENECAYICDAENAIVCPQGWACGSDQRCRRHSGLFEPAEGSPHRFDVDTFAFADLNGDGKLDVIGQDLADLRVLFGDDEADFETEFTIASGLARGPMTIGEFTSDGRADVVLPLVEGVSVFTGGADDSLQPVLFAPFSLDDTFGPEDVLVVVPFESVPEPANSLSEVLVLIDAYSDSGAYEGSLMAFFDDNGGAVALPGNARAAQLAGRVPVADVDGDAQGRSELVLAFTGARSLWVYTSSGGGATPLTPVLLQEVSLGTREVRDGAHFGDFDGDGDLDIIVSVSDAGSHKVMVSLNNGAGTFGVPSVQPVFNRAFGSPFPLAVANIDGTPHADYVFPEAIYLARRMDGGVGAPESLQSVAATQAVLWRQAVVGDFNGDGRLDVATSFEEEDGIDVFINSDTLYPNRFRVGTTDQAKQLRVGDFDGDLKDDIAFLQRHQGEAADGVYVVYGGSDGPGEDAVSMGELGGIESFEVVLGQTLFTDGISDLYVITRTGPSGEFRNVALLQGSSARRLASPYILNTGIGGGIQPDIPLQVFVGQFTGDSVPDIVAIADVLGNDATMRDFRLWALPGAMGDGGLKTEQITYLDIKGSDFEAECAAWTNGDLDGDGIEEIIAIDGGSDCGNRDFARAPRLLIGRNPGGMNGAFEKTIVDMTSDLRGIAELSLIDLDNDGDVDVLARFVGDPQSIDPSDFTISKGGLMVLWNEQGSISVDNYATIELPSGAVLLGAAAAKLSTATEPSLIAVTIEGVYTSALDTGANDYAAPTLSPLAGGTGRIQVGDLNNDGLDDIAYVVNRDVEVLLGQPAEPLGASQ